MSGQRPSPFVEYLGHVYNVYATQVSDVIKDFRGKDSAQREKDLQSIIVRRMEEIAAFDRRATANLTAGMMGR
jgi:hypothetical protein